MQDDTKYMASVVAPEHEEGARGTREGKRGEEKRTSFSCSLSFFVFVGEWGEGRGEGGERPTRCDALVKLVPYGASFMSAGYRSSSETFVFARRREGIIAKFERNILYSFALE